MIAELYEKLRQGINVRQNLIKAKELLRGKDRARERDELLSHCGGDFSVLLSCLSSEDAKARKNAALVIGELSVPKLLTPLWEAYEAEQTRFVRSAHLTALKSYDYAELLPRLKDALKRVGAEEVCEENRKHLQEERMLLRGLISAKEDVKPHCYTGDGLVCGLVLTTNRNHKHVLLSGLGACRKKELAAGVMVQTKEASSLYGLRTFEEMFFVLPGCKTVPADPGEAAKALVQAGLASYLKERHKENGAPFRFRIELRSTMTLEKRSAFVRRMAAVLEEQGRGELVNVTDGYEVELRLIETKEKSFHVLLKLFTLRDYRFAYRRKTIAAGMRPFLAAFCMALAGDETDGGGHSFFRENAQVLDPFCGAGTMLIERAKYAPVKQMFGLDILEEAVLAARENTRLADERANYVHRDFFTFQREEAFDEIVTDMPFTVSENEERKQEIAELYRRFFLRAPEFLKEDGVLLLLTHDRGLVKKYGQVPFVCLKEFELSMKEGSYLFLMRKCCQQT